MPKNTELQLRQKKDAVRGVLLFLLFQLACAACAAALCFIPGLPGWAVMLFAVLAGIPLLMAVPALAVLKQRFYEIQGGELDAARQY
ncbi:MAG: hypothetical protein K2O18_01600 [Oscillospiraceae bacterium]|nr:hypothetical protein [Oscillospiraceae bacterium]